MHKMKIVHRDLKPQNILLNSDGKNITSSKLCDLGLSKSLKSMKEAWQSFCGTYQYMAPELHMMNIGGSSQSTYKVDIWSYGLILY